MCWVRGLPPLRLARQRSRVSSPGHHRPAATTPLASSAVLELHSAILSSVQVLHRETAVSYVTEKSNQCTGLSPKLQHQKIHKE